MSATEVPLSKSYEVLLDEWGFRKFGFNIGQASKVIDHRSNFFVDFITAHPNEVTSHSGIVLIGTKELHSPILDTLINQSSFIQSLVDKHGGDRKQPLAVVYIGSNYELQEKFRSEGSGHASALLGGIDSFLNGNEILEAGVQSPLGKRIILHEPTHAMFNSVLPLTPSGKYATDNDRIVHEALAGPPPEYWLDVPSDDRVSINDLLGLGFWEWYHQQCSALGHNEIYFQNPVAKAFYEWVNQTDTLEGWYLKAKSLTG